MFESRVEHMGSVALPHFSAVRVMMMPFWLHNPIGSIPWQIIGREWIGVVDDLCKFSPVAVGVGYLTIDEAIVEKGQTHRRPGLHVDGVDEQGRPGGWGGGGGYAGQEGMLLVSNAVGCVAWDQTFEGAPGPDGDCEHLRFKCLGNQEIVMQPGQVYLCGPLTVHESLPMPCKTRRQFCRISMPSTAAWYEGYTENPLGVKPTGPIRPRRPGMDYRP